jgi:RHS repeat-associated protein
MHSPEARGRSASSPIFAKTAHCLAFAAALLFSTLAASTASAQMSATRSSSFAYDSTSGLLTQEVIEPNTQSLRLETDYTYDGFGNKTQASVSGVDITTRSTSTTYDAQGRFATQVTNALSQSETWAFDARFGVPTSHTGPNGLTTTWSYDGFGRKILETRADGTQTKLAYQFCSGFNGGSASCPAGAVFLMQSTPLASDGATQNGPQSTAYVDRRGRTIFADSQGFDGSLIRASTQYDSFGRVKQTSRPYFVNGGTPVFTVPSYDALNRVVETTFPDGSTLQTAYHGLSATVTDALNQTRTTVKNGQGLVASITDAAGKVTSYVYDPFGNLLQTTDPAGNIAAFAYDTRGRKTQTHDPDMGVWSYAYDTLSELTTQTDAKSQATTFQYDTLGRLTQRVEPDMTCAWTYDTATMGIGKLASAGVTSGPSNGYQRAYTYDSLGRPSQVAITVNSTTYTIGTTYDSNGRVATATYPSGFALQYAYTALGYQQQVLNNATGQAFWTANARDASLNLTEQTAGNGIVTNETFDPNTGRLTAIGAGTGSTVENFSYVYDALGNVTTRQDVNAALTETFQYDSLNRLTSSTITGSSASPPAKSFAYDALGNITTKSDVGTYTYPAAGAPLPHAVTSISGGTISATFTYDANGNQTGGNGRTIGYSSYNMPSSIAQGSVNVSFTHDTEHQRLTKTDTNGSTVTTTVYLGAGAVLAEKVTGASGAVTWNEYVSAGGGLVAVRFNNVTANTLSTRYVHADQLGSVATLTDESGNVAQRLSYDPWGKQRNASTWADDTTGVLPTQDQTTRGYTGQEQLADVGLVHMNGRVYDPQLGRFISPDPYVQDPFNAQSLNRYSYVYDNPLAYTDPTGHFLSGLFRAVGDFFSHAFNEIGNQFDSFARGLGEVLRRNPLLGAVLEIFFVALCGPGAPACAIAVAAASSAVVGGLAGGNLSAALKAGAIAGATAAAFYGVGELTTPEAQAEVPVGGGAASPTAVVPGQISFDTPGALAANIIGHAAVGCASAAASGGDCGAAALAGAVSAGAGPAISSLNLGFAGSLAAETALGGISAVAGGGKFANGAVTGAFGYLFNSAPHSADQEDPLGHPFGTLEQNVVVGASLVGGEILGAIGFVARGIVGAYDFLVGLGEGSEIGTMLADGTVVGADAAGAAPNLARLGAKFGINADSEVGANILNNLNTPVSDFISANRQASIMRVFPRELLDGTVAQALGDSTARKLLLDSRFAK